MAIDKAGKWWKGESFADLAEYIAEFTAEGYPAAIIKQAHCECGGELFMLHANRTEGCVSRTCVACKRQVFIADSGENWGEASPRKVRCKCRGDQFEVGVGFSLRDDDEVRWVTVGNRCRACGILGSCADWKIDYSPSRHLLEQI